MKDDHHAKFQDRITIFNQIILKTTTRIPLYSLSNKNLEIVLSHFTRYKRITQLNTKTKKVFKCEYNLPRHNHEKHLNQIENYKNTEAHINMSTF